MNSNDVASVLIGASDETDMRHMMDVTCECDECGNTHTFRVMRASDEPGVMDRWATEPNACGFWVGREYTDAVLMMSPGNIYL